MTANRYLIVIILVFTSTIIQAEHFRMTQQSTVTTTRKAADSPAGQFDQSQSTLKRKSRKIRVVVESIPAMVGDVQWDNSEQVNSQPSKDEAKYMRRGEAVTKVAKKAKNYANFLLQVRNEARKQRKANKSNVIDVPSDI
jgi:hypothetical protein